MEWYLSNLKLIFKNIDEDQSAFLNYALPYDSDEIISEFCFIFDDKDANYIPPAPANVFKLSNQIISFCQNKYYVDYLDGRRGIWDCHNKLFTYNFSGYSNIRHWFMQTILDPLSISCVQYNKVVLHGALWSYDDYGILVLGNSGSGKSTISYLLKDAVNVLADDVFIVSFKSDSFYAEPINVGFGISLANSLSDYVMEDDILIATKKKKYLKSLYPSVEVDNKRILPIRLILILRKGCGSETNIETPSLFEVIKVVLDSQTNIKSTYLYSKFLFFKKMLSECDVRFVNYSDMCSVEKIQTCIKERAKQ